MSTDPHGEESDDSFQTGLIYYTKYGETICSAAPEALPRKLPHQEFLTFLGIAQSLHIDFLPITWQPKLESFGLGGTAEIEQAQIMLETSYAFKRLRDLGTVKKDKNFPALIAEIAVLGHPSIRRHPNIVGLEGVCWDINSKSGRVWPVLVFGKAQNGDLKTFMERGEGKSLSFRDRLKFCIDICIGVRAMHSNSIIHGDIKPQNVLIYEHASTKFVAKVADFGWSTVFTNSDTTIKLPGSRFWVAPEWHHRDFRTDVIGAKKMDSYSFGSLCLWLLFYNRHEIANSSFFNALQSAPSPLSLASDHLSAAKDPEITSNATLHDFFNRTLQMDPKSRISNFDELLRLLSPKDFETNQIQQQQRLDTGIPSGNFQIAPSMSQLYSADYRVRCYIAECLKTCVREAPSHASTNFAFELALCYKVGFGVAKDGDLSSSYLRQSNLTQDNLEHLLSTIKEKPDLPQFRDSAYGDFVNRGYDLMIDFAEHYRTENQLEAACSWYRREIDDLESVLGADHLMTHSLRTQLFHVLLGMSHLEEAITLREKSTETIKKVLGENNPNTLLSMKHLAAVYQDHGRSKEAEEIQTRVLEIEQSSLGKEHPYILESLGLLSVIYSSQSRWKEAEKLQLQIVQVRKAVLGPTHPDTLRSMVSLATTYAEQRRLDTAEEQLIDLVDTCKLLLGKENRVTLTSMTNLANVYRYQNRLDDAEKLEFELAATKKEVLGKEHQSTLLALSNLASTRKDLGRLEDAQKDEEELVEIKERVLGPNHQSTLLTLGNLAMTYGLRERWEEARSLGKEVVSRKKDLLGKDHASTLASMANLADAYKALGQVYEAGNLLEEATGRSVTALGVEHPISKGIMSRLLSLREGQEG